MFGKWNDLNQYLLVIPEVIPSGKFQKCMGPAWRKVEQSYKSVIQSYSSSFLQWPHTAQLIVGAQKISVRLLL